MDKKTENLFVFQWLVALIATLGSLYFSQIKQYEPCTLCWVQRIFMYPLVVIIFIGIVLKDRNVAYYSAILAAIGCCFSIYHYSLQKITFFASIAPACGRIPCTGQYINWLGFITIPFLAGTAFLIIFISSLIVIKNRRMSE